MGYQPKVYRKQGGDELVIASGGTLTVDSGGTISIDAGATVYAAVTAVTAVGSVQSLATNSLSVGFNVIKGGGTDLGLKLPAPAVGMQVIVKNATASAAIVYGSATAVIINALATTTGFSVATTKTATFICENSTQWWTVPLAVA